jgi:hypothetical protein
MLFTSKTHLVWRPVECAEFYNLYRALALVDADNDGLADDYGTCFMPGLLLPMADDFSIPNPGRLFSYLVTSVNALGESDLGTNSAGVVRPNLNPCP